MAKRTIRLSTDEILRKKCRPVKEIPPSVLTLLDDMYETMTDANGVGLAAPQVGILKRVVVIDIGEGKIELINPEVTLAEGSQVGDEGCLSIPGATAKVDRPDHVIVSALDRFGNPIQVEGKGLLARALCHETDHLDGILYIDKAMDDEIFLPTEEED